MSKIIVSFATIPTRIEHIEPVIHSLLEQTVKPDEIHIQAPLFCKKTSSGFEFPSFLKSYEPTVKIKERGEDFGAVNKWYYPLIDFEQDDDALILIADDDCFYRKYSIEKLLEKYKERNACYCYSGGLLPKLPEQFESLKSNDQKLPNTLTLLTDNSSDVVVDTVQGFAMYLLDPKWFREIDLSAVVGEDSTSHNDDIILSGVLEHLMVERVQVGPYYIPHVLDQAEIDPIHGDGRLTRMSKAALSKIQEILKTWAEIAIIHESPQPDWLTRVKSKIPIGIKRRLKATLGSR